MKKFLSSLLVIFMLLTLLCACDGGVDTSDPPVSGAEPSESSDPSVPDESVTPDESVAPDTSDASEAIDPYDPSIRQEIPDGMLTVTENGTVFSEDYTTVTLPNGWKTEVRGSSDGTCYAFVHPELGSKCELAIDISSADYVYKRTEAEYLSYLSDSCGYSDVKIESYASAKLDGYDCTKIVSAYTVNGESFVRTDYNCLVVKYRQYSFTAVYPESQKEEFEKLFESVFDSVEIEEKEIIFADTTAEDLFEKVLAADAKIITSDSKGNERETTFRDYLNSFRFETELAVDGMAEYDIDRDGSKEIFLSLNPALYNDIGTVLIRYYDSKVYVWDFTYRNLTDLHSDGSFTWNYQGTYGLNYFVFEGSKLTQLELYSVANDGTPDAEYYVRGEEVTKEEFDAKRSPYNLMTFFGIN